MIDFEQARKIVMERINASIPVGLFYSDDGPVIVDDSTIAKDYGWIFVYNSKKFLETGNISDCLVGNGPILVLKKDGSLIEMGTAYTIEEQLVEIEKTISL